MEWWAVLLPWINAQAGVYRVRRGWDGKMGKDLEKVEETSNLFVFPKKNGVIIAATCGSYYCNIGNHLLFQEFSGWWSITRSTKFMLGWVVSVFCVSWMSWDWASTKFASKTSAKCGNILVFYFVASKKPHSSSSTWSWNSGKSSWANTVTVALKRYTWL